MKQTHSKRSLRQKMHHHIKRGVVPHAANQFRPFFVRSYALLLLVGVVGATFIMSHPSQQAVLGTEATVTSQQLLDGTNAERQKNGIAPLAYSDKLSTAAFLKAKDMLTDQYWAHVAPDGATPWQWVTEAGYNYAYAGENLAKNFQTAPAAMTAWMASPTHRQNILDSHYTEAGFAVADGTLQGKQVKLIVALYAQPAAPAVAGALAPQTSLPTAVGTLSPVTRFGIAIQSMTPAMVGSLMLLLFAAVVALTAHAYRRQMPQAVRESWRYHHGLYKSIGLVSLAVVIVALYSGGQI